MDYRTKVAAAWWANALREKQQGNHDIVSEPQLEAFEAALAREIDKMLRQDLTHVLAVNHRWAAPQFSDAAASCGINGIVGKLPGNTVMRIFPKTVMTHTGPQSQMEIVWSSHRTFSGESKAKDSSA